MSALNGKHVLVTGGAQGLGAEIAKQAIEAGGTVTIVDVLDEAGVATAAALGPAATYHHLDVTSVDDWTRALAACERLDGLVNNAAILHMGSLERTPLDVAHRLLDVNVYGVFLGIRECAPSAAPRRARLGGEHLVHRRPRRHE